MKRFSDVFQEFNEWHDKLGNVAEKEHEFQLWRDVTDAIGKYLDEESK